MFAGKIVGCVEDDGRKGYATTTMVYDGEIGNNMVFLRYWVLILPLFSLANGKWNGENVAHGIEKRM